MLGRARSLMVATILGFIGIVAFIGLAFWAHDVWLGAIAVFMLIELLGRIAARAGAVTFRKVAAPGGICLPGMQNLAADRRILEVRPVWAGIRYFPDAGCLPQLRDAVLR